MAFVGTINSDVQFRNRIINGAMVIDQRNAGAAVTINTTANVYTIDRWNAAGALTDGVFTVDQDTTAPTGFTNSLKVTVTTADASIGAGQSYILSQFIEGFNVADLGWGTASAKTITVSFWVQSSVIGTFGGVLNNSGNSRNYPFTYAISVANTWEYKTVTIAGDTTGTWLTDSGRGIALRFGFGLGSDFLATANAWTGTSQIFGATGQTQLISTLNATWYITGVQFEVGSVATPFERRPYGMELTLCQRYYYRLIFSAGDPVCTAASYGSGFAFGVVSFPVAMRTLPDIDQTSNSGQFWVTGNAASVTFTTFAYNERSVNAITLYNNESVSITQGYAYWLRSNSTVANPRLAFSAEL